MRIIYFEIYQISDLKLGSEKKDKEFPAFWKAQNWVTNQMKNQQL
jgi:hypothetical protein